MLIFHSCGPLLQDLKRSNYPKCLKQLRGECSGLDFSWILRKLHKACNRWITHPIDGRNTLFTKQWNSPKKSVFEDTSGSCWKKESCKSLFAKGALCHCHQQFCVRGTATKLAVVSRRRATRQGLSHAKVHLFASSKPFLSFKNSVFWGGMLTVKLQKPTINWWGQSWDKPHPHPRTIILFLSPNGFSSSTREESCIFDPSNTLHKSIYYFPFLQEKYVTQNDWKRCQFSSPPKIPLVAQTHA